MTEKPSNLSESGFHRRLDAFISDCLERIDEIELYLAQMEELYSPDNISGILRRLRAMDDEAVALGLSQIHEVNRALVGFLQELPEQIPPQALEMASSAVEFFRKSFQYLEASTRFNRVPAQMTGFLQRVSQSLIRELTDFTGLQTIPDTGPLGRRLRIAIADDEEVVRAFLAELIEDRGHLAVELKDGGEAQFAIESGFIDLMFADINMPIQTGIEVLRHAQEISADTEIVIVTGFATVENAAQAVRFGAYDYLTKPFRDAESIANIVRRIGNHLALHRKNKKLMLELKRKNEELNHYAIRLEDALESIAERNQALLHTDRMATIGVLAAGVAHEINNPTTFIHSNTQIFQRFWNTIEPVLRNNLDQVPDELVKQVGFVLNEMPTLIRDMAKGTERIAKITGGLRSFARQDQTVEFRENASIGECVHEAIELLHPKIPDDTDVDVSMPDPDPTIRVNSQQITQVFVNLISNALDAVEKQETQKIEVHGRLEEDVLRVTIRDNGPGIPEPIRPRIFDPFFTTKSVGKGTGLGLSIILGILRDHGGTISALPSNEGAVFEVCLPCSPEKVLEKPALRILIADDNEDSIKAIAAGLQALGRFDVKSVTSGERALAVIEASPPDLLILDAMIPDLDGFEIVSRLKKNPATADLPILALTGMMIDGIRERMLKLGVKDVFYKPCRISKLLMAIEKYAVQKKG